MIFLNIYINYIFFLNIFGFSILQKSTKNQNIVVICNTKYTVYIFLKKTKMIWQQRHNRVRVYTMIRANIYAPECVSTAPSDVTAPILPN